MNKIEIAAFLKQIQERLGSLREVALTSMGEVNSALTGDHLDLGRHTLARLRKETLKSLGRLDSALADVHAQIEQALADLEEHPPAAH